MYSFAAKSFKQTSAWLWIKYGQLYFARNPTGQIPETSTTSSHLGHLFQRKTARGPPVQQFAGLALSLAGRFRLQGAANPDRCPTVVAYRVIQRLEERGSATATLLPGLGPRIDFLHTTLARIKIAGTQ
jgi:hypothetical protein